MSSRKGTGSMFKQPGCRTWMIKYYQGGKCVREATGLTDRQAVRQKLNQRLNQIDTGNFAGPQMERIPVDDLAQDFLRDYRVNCRKSVGHAEARWEKHLKPFFGMMRVSAVTSDVIAKYVDARLQEGAENSTINRELAALRRMFRLGYHATPPKVFRLPAFPRLREDNVGTGFLEDGQYDNLKSEISEAWLRAFIEVARTFGWRKRELLSLRVRQVNLRQRVIRLEPGTTKNRDAREGYMTQNIYALISQCVQGKSPDDFVFTRADGKPVLDFRKAWRNLCGQAGLGRMVCCNCSRPVADEKCATCGGAKLKYVGLILHDLRRTAARNLRKAGVAEGVIMRVGGWRTRSIFERYNIVSQADQQDAMRKLEQHQAQNGKAENPDGDSPFGHDSGHDSNSADTASGIERIN